MPPLLPSEKLELAIYQYIAPLHPPVQVSFPYLAQMVGESDERRLVERLKDLELSNRVLLSKYSAGQRLPRKSFASDAAFFGRDSFLIEVAPQGRRYFEELEQRAEHEEKPVAVHTMANDRTQVFETTFNVYRDAGVLGEGGAGRVHRVIDEEGGYFALKVLHAASTQQRKRFQNEIGFCSKRSSAHIIVVLDHGLTFIAGKQCPFYVMPLYEATLRKLMMEGLKPGEVLQHFAQILDGVQAAHLQEVVHRDLKPENVLYDRSNNNFVIADFGIAQFTEETLVTAVETRPQERLANWLYAAPEQRVRGGKVTSQSDIYALGLILNEMFTGEVLQGTGYKRIGTIAAQYAYLDELVDLMVRHSAHERPTSIADVKQELIARGNDFVSQQKLDQLKGTFVTETDIDDPMLANPIAVTGIDYDPNGWLLFHLSGVPTHRWIQTFHNLGNYSAIVGYEPYRFQFPGQYGQIQIDNNVLQRQGQAQILANHVKNYVQQTNAAYKEKAIAEHKKIIADQRRNLRARIEQAEAVQRLRESIRSIKL